MVADAKICLIDDIFIVLDWFVDAIHHVPTV